ncbi:MAG TPA: DUF4157 domain-containing protein [Gammaproteobacteria bacterium]|nr:DUF4157 domain-containing protein [Gammaproteobacteria bacterium]
MRSHSLQPKGPDLGPGRPLDSRTRSRMYDAFGQSFDDVRLHETSRARQILRSENAVALTYGTSIALDPGALPAPDSLERDVVLAHELAHVQQQKAGHGSATAAHEESADITALAVAGRLAGSSARPTPGIQSAGLTLQRCSKPVEDALSNRRPFTAKLAREALRNYRGMSPADRDRVIALYYPTGTYYRLLHALPPADASGAYATEVRDMEQRIQRLAARSYARRHGLTSEAAMAQAQANMMHKRNLAAAQAAHGPSPTPSQIAAEQASQTASTSIAPSSSTLSAAQIASWTVRAYAAVATVVSHAAAHHPELHLNVADFHVDVAGIENRGVGVVAYGGRVGGRNVCVVGRPFVRLVDANPAYVMSVVVHELHGHPEYGPYGVSGTEYGLELYDRAAALMPGYTQPTGPGRTAEIDAYAYQETEIYSLLRSLPYHTAPTAADASVQPLSIDPASTVNARIGLIKRQWTPIVGQSLLRGLYQRLRHDPRITPDALNAFRQGIRNNYKGAEASIAAAILA